VVGSKQMVRAVEALNTLAGQLNKITGQFKVAEPSAPETVVEPSPEKVVKLMGA